MKRNFFLQTLPVCTRSWNKAKATPYGLSFQLHRQSQYLYQKTCYIPISGQITDSSVVELSQRITCESELIDLGINVLNLPEHTVQSALYEKKETQSAAFKLLTTWLHQQTSRHDAYNTLHSALKKADHNELAAQLKRWVEGFSVHSPLSRESKYQKVPPTVRISVLEICFIFHTKKVGQFYSHPICNSFLICRQNMSIAPIHLGCISSS